MRPQQAVKMIWGRARRCPAVAACALAVMGGGCSQHRGGPAEPRHAHHGGAHQHHRHHGGHHRFQDPEKWARVFESPERDAWQRPDQVVAALRLTPTMTVADIGAGTGYFAVRLARAVPRGRVYAVDIEQPMVRYLERRARRAGLPQLSAVLGAAEDPRLPAPVDLIFLCNTYHHIPHRVAYFHKLRSKLRPGGRLVLVEFKLGPLPVGPPETMRVGPEQLERELRAAGYRRTGLERATLPHQYIATYQLDGDTSDQARGPGAGSTVAPSAPVE